MMRRRISYRVCRCTPCGVVTHLEARLLKDLVNRTIHPIRCASNCKQMFMKGMRIGDLCAETGHFWWALKVWRWTMQLMDAKDYDDWIEVRFDGDRVSLKDVVSETEYELLSRRCSDLWRALGYPEYAWWNAEWERITSETFGSSYGYLWAEKYDYYPLCLQMEWDEEMKVCRAEHHTQLLFREGQGDNLPSCSQDFTEYWHEGPHHEDFSFFYTK